MFICTKSVKVSITVSTTVLLTWMFGLLCSTSSLSTKDTTASSVVEAESNPCSKYTFKIILLYSLVGMQKYKIEY